MCFTILFKRDVYAVILLKKFYVMIILRLGLLGGIVKSLF